MKIVHPGISSSSRRSSFQKVDRRTNLPPPEEYLEIKEILINLWEFATKNKFDSSNLKHQTSMICLVKHFVALQSEFST